jgi:hypothetical protein
MGLNPIPVKTTGAYRPAITTGTNQSLLDIEASFKGKEHVKYYRASDSKRARLSNTVRVNGIKLKALIKSKGLKSRTVSKAVKIDANRFNRILFGSKTDPCYIELLAEYLNVSYEELLLNDED